MTDWIRCSDRMPMGEACEVRLDEFIEGYRCATVETLRQRFGSYPNWIDRTVWRPRPVGETDLEPHVYTVKPGYDEAVHDFLHSAKPVPEKLRELMADRKVE